MKNLLTLRTEKLEELPSRETRNPRPRRNHKTSKQHRFGTQYPYNKVHRFMQSSVGQRWNDVFHKYCNLEWIPADLRNLEYVKRTVIVDTFMKGGKVVYIPSYRSAEEPVDTIVIGGETERFYVHPQTKLLSVIHLGQKRAAEQKQKIKHDKTWRILGDYHQLIKQKGLWTEVKAERVGPDNGDLVQIKGLWYRPADAKPVERWVNGVLLKDIAPADGVKYFIHDGKLYLPAKAPIYYSGWRHPLGKRERIIPEDTNKPRWMRYNDVDPYSFKITLQRQLSTKELKRYGLKNDDPILHIKRCKKCGGIVGKDCLYHFCAVCEKPKDDCKCNPW